MQGKIIVDERYESAAFMVSYIAARTGYRITEQTFREWRRPGGPASFVEVGSSGGNYSGQAAWTMPLSLDNLCDVILPEHRAKISEVRRAAALKSWADGSKRFVPDKTEGSLTPGGVTCQSGGQAIREKDEII